MCRLPLCHVGLGQLSRWVDNFDTPISSMGWWFYWHEVLHDVRCFERVTSSAMAATFDRWGIRSSLQIGWIWLGWLLHLWRRQSCTSRDAVWTITSHEWYWVVIQWWAVTGGAVAAWWSMVKPPGCWSKTQSSVHSDNASDSALTVLIEIQVEREKSARKKTSLRMCWPSSALFWVCLLSHVSTHP